MKNSFTWPSSCPPNGVRGERLAGPSDGATGPSADDVRKLQPGGIDFDPETKPARPDPIDRRRW